MTILPIVYVGILPINGPSWYTPFAPGTPVTVKHPRDWLAGLRLGRRVRVRFRLGRRVRVRFRLGRRVRVRFRLGRRLPI